MRAKITFSTLVLIALAPACRPADCFVCGRGPSGGLADSGAGQTRNAGRCASDMEWGGWDGTEACARIAHTWIPKADLGCSVDADCVLVGRSRCGTNSVAQSAASRWISHAPACGPPGIETCPEIEFGAICHDGCCNVGIVTD